MWIRAAKFKSSTGNNNEIWKHRRRQRRLVCGESTERISLRVHTHTHTHTRKYTINIHSVLYRLAHNTTYVLSLMCTCAISDYFMKI